MNAKTLTIPNIITFSRIILSPIIWIHIIYRKPVVAVILFGIAALSDFLDGFIARKLEQVSSLGKIMDMIADRILMLGTFTTLFIKENLELPIFLILVAHRALLGLQILILKLVYHRTFTPNPRPTGKICTGVEIIYALWILLAQNPPQLLKIILIFIEISTAVDYFVSIWKNK